MPVDAFLADLSAVLPERALVREQERVAPWLTDWRGRWTGASKALLEPGTTEEVAIIVRLSGEHRVGLVPQGGNTSMVGGATPPADGDAVLLSLRRMTRVRALEAGSAIVEAGVILADLHAAAAASGQRFPLTLGARGSATVGGLIATNAGGTQVLRFGTMRAQVLGLEAVIAGGLVHDGLGGLKKDNRGTSLDQLLIGSEGTLGIVTAARLRLIPAIAERGVAWVGLDSAEAAWSLLGQLEEASERVEGFELVPAECLASVLDHVPGTRSPLEQTHRWNALIEVTAGRGEPEPPTATLERLLAPALESGRVADAVIAGSEAQAEALWKLRDSISEAERKRGPAAQHDISVPPAVMARFMTDAATRVEHAFPGTRAFGYGHLGDGNVHFHVRAPAASSRDWAESGEGKAVSRLVHDLVTDSGGSISAEHGIGQMKKDELARLASPARLQALRAIKQAMDPRGIFNPGKLVD
ncbi:FAD-binding oxidoreductase [Sphingomonas swuensis]